MPLPSRAHIEAAFPDTRIVDERRTFQNVLLRATWSGQSVYIKGYSSLEHYETERAVLTGFELGQNTAHFRWPQLLASSDQYRSLVFKALSGVPLDEKTEKSCRLGFAKILGGLHKTMPYQLGEEIDLYERIQLYRKNIVSTSALLPEEKKIAELAVKKLTKDAIIVQTDDRGAIHGDMNPGNILYDATNPCPFAVIDFERACRGSYFIDIAKFCWRGLASDHDLSRCFLEGYFNGRPTTKDQQRLAWYLMYEYLGAISYFSYRGFSEGYPYKDMAMEQLKKCI